MYDGLCLSYLVCAYRIDIISFLVPNIFVISYLNLVKTLQMSPFSECYHGQLSNTLVQLIRLNDTLYYSLKRPSVMVFVQLFPFYLHSYNMYKYRNLDIKIKKEKRSVLC